MAETLLSERTKEHMADVLAVNDNERIDPDVWSGPTRMLGHLLLYVAAGFVLGTFIVIGVMLS